jgi:hypothetical protein
MPLRRSQRVWAGHLVPAPGSPEKAASLDAETERGTICNGKIHFIHESTHERARGRRRVNIGTTFECIGDIGIDKGEAAVLLLFSPKDHPSKMSSRARATSNISPAFRP